MIGIIGPCEEEIEDFIKSMIVEKVEKYAMLEFHIGTYGDKPVIALFCGVGKVNATIATQILITKFSVKHIILNGVAGGLCDSLKVGDIVVATDVAHHDVEEEIIINYHPYLKNKYIETDKNLLEKLSYSEEIHFGKIVTGEYFVTDKTRETIIEKFSPLCVDMESAAVAQCCFSNEISFNIIRSISDFADENSTKSFENNVQCSALTAIDVTKKLISLY